MLSLLARAVVVSVHGHKQLSTAPIGIHLRSVDKDTEEMVRTILYTVNLALFLPALLYVGYTLSSVIPTLTAIESPQGTYVPIPVHDEDEAEGKAGNAAAQAGNVAAKAAEESEGKDGSGPASAAVPEADEAGAIKRRPITSSLRGTHKHLCSVTLAGWHALFRGLVLAFATHFASYFPAFVFFVTLPPVPPAVPVFLAEVAMIQLDTAWVHSVIATSHRPWWRRLPPFVPTLKATVLPLAARFLATTAASALPTLVLLAMGRPMEKREILPLIQINTVRTEGGDEVLYWGLWLGLLVFVAVPAHIVVVRVQASLLPDADQPLVPFDRALGRTSPEPPSAVQRMVAALTSFSGSWQRYYRMKAKTTILSIAIAVAVCAVLGAEFLVVSYFMSK